MNAKQTESSPASFCELTPAAERRLREFESAWAQSGSPDIATFADDLDQALLEELVRVDMEFRAERGLLFSVSTYLERFQILKNSTGAVARIESEANRLKNLGRSKRSGSASSFPVVPQVFFGFELIGVLGEGAFGRVYLARQGDLAKRLVVLKITTTRTAEGERLAQLQHTNIVPIYSQHLQGGLQAICMPFLGIATLADLVPTSSSAALDTTISPREFVSTVARKKSKTIPVLSEAIFSSHGTESFSEKPKLLKDQSSSTSEIETSLTGQPTVILSGSYEAIGSRSREETFGWLWHQTASGLAFAHSHGIIHGDVKPANILISDRGYPMLLDFNLAINRRDRAPNIVGGTLPYLSPEQIQAISAGTGVDERSDLYSLGVVFYQLLSGHLPFPDRGNDFQTASKQMLEDRLQGTTPIGKLLPNLNSNLASIIDKSLHWQLENRYQSAAELLEDLQCFLEFKPLRHAPNRSVVLTARNWLRRHPRMTSASSVALVAAILLTGIAWLTFASWKHNSKLEAAENTRQWIDDLKTIRYQLSSVDPPPSTLEARAGELARLIDQPPAGIEVDEIIDNRSSLLSSTQAVQAKQEIVASRLGLAGALLRRCYGLDEDRKPLVAQIEQQHHWILQNTPQKSESAGFLLQQSRLASLSGDPDKATQLREKAEQLRVDDSFDRNLLAYELLTLGECDSAAELLEQAVGNEGLDREAWLLLGNARVQQKRLPEAEACFSVCISLEENSETAIYNRARVRFDLGNLAGAHADYGRAIQLNSNEPAYFANRALISMTQRDWQKSEQDFSQALRLPGAETRILYLRHQANSALGRQQAASEDLAAFLKTQPTDEASWVLRGVANLRQGNRPQALKDFEEALKSNPKSSMAWQNKATILAADSSAEKAAIEAMTKVVELDPLNPTQIATRGVLFARAGKRMEAHRDAEAALKLNTTADTRYRVAGIYALTAKIEPSDKDQAIALIAMAALEQPKLVLSYVEHDPDIEALKADPKWLELFQALEKIRQQAQFDPAK